MTKIDQDHVWEMMDGIRIAMFITWDGSRQSARPMAAMPRQDEHAIYFFTGANAEKDDQIEEFPIVTLAFVDQSKNDYVSITGVAKLSNDRAKIKDLWSPMMKSWWDSPEDPDLRLIKFTPEDAQAWDGPHDMVSTIKMVAAAAGLGKPDLGDSGKVTM
ncbi:pyridoxamine 5'-phosphate oxidase family protein [Hoeflea ulvae]|uniref:Pyridoxamine 5'-phosphate oxidase family protein n=1 Tax=Hoeflea ulvae TaxID=2983764 RepID=A0ABT3YF34_9HYPH|nr:pyridoxamine 5'-phosphate oxidase family protein [Hoeflea ulvae]MCY0094483.1 pyridoxamine 5'-phosphate oxidase family protein [Hoeflea ulvae]